MRAINHIGLRVRDLREAEAFYCDLFDLSVAFREAELTDGWATLPEHAGWDDAVATGITLDLTVLKNGGFHLALRRAEAVVPAVSGLDHVAVEVDLEALEALRARAEQLGCRRVADSPRLCLFEDPLGVTWEITLGGEGRSTGSSKGRWLKV